MEKAGTDVKNAAVNAYHGTKTAAKDSDVTGTVLSGSVSERAEEIAHVTASVERVRNRLRVASAASSG